MNKIFIKKPGLATSIIIFTKVGSRYEPNYLKGISHVVEHMCFKGTKTKNTQQIAKAIEKYGSYFNAMTGPEATAYIVKTANKYNDKSLEILMDMLHNSIFAQKELDKELKVILEELKMYEDNPKTKIFELFLKQITYETDGLHFPVIGTCKSLGNINRAELLKFYNSYYKDLTLVVVGDVPTGLVDKNLDIKIPETLSHFKLLEKGAVFEEYKRDISQTSMLLGGVISISDNEKIENYFMLELMSAILNDMSGRLFTEVREKHNLVYYVSFDFEMFRNGDIIWQIPLGLARKNVTKAYDIIINQLGTLKNISDSEIKYAVTKFIGETSLRYDSGIKIARDIVEYDSLNIDFKRAIFDYETLIRDVSKRFKDWVKRINFENNIITLISPK